ncbi:Protein-export membrane protein SecG [Candidatus Erwinia haradaeae]|uniref:Protein-export membrane protein SecG n=1 Tax=Candidatus Erwinia haradaeae TaxID=1922217 RepID=A0A451DDF6_9GAMM|nr:Protein-export membrane protein SecG [Candidatus Erwinia haradaeae]
MYTAILIVFLSIAIILISLILLQQGKGSIMGASLSSGASGTLFGSHGVNNFITFRIIPLLAILFFFLSLILGNFNSHKSLKGSSGDHLIHRVDVPAVSVPHHIPS